MLIGLKFGFDLSLNRNTELVQAIDRVGGQRNIDQDKFSLYGLRTTGKVQIPAPKHEKDQHSLIWIEQVTLII